MSRTYTTTSLTMIDVSNIHIFATPMNSLPRSKIAQNLSYTYLCQLLSIAYDTQNHWSLHTFLPNNHPPQSAPDSPSSPPACTTGTNTMTYLWSPTFMLSSLLQIWKRCRRNTLSLVKMWISDAQSTNHDHCPIERFCIRSSAQLRRPAAKKHATEYISKRGQHVQ
jgi:hypothetical protein